MVRSGRDRYGYDYTPEALAVFPRYNVLNAIRIEIERLDPDILCDLDDTRELLILAGSVAEDDFTQRSICESDANVMAEERASFCSCVAFPTPTYSVLKSCHISESSHSQSQNSFGVNFATDGK